jgi:ABC-type microcin C transport system duplicated ATPase subunit YejF
MTSLNPVLTIGRQLREPLETHLGLHKKEALGRAAELLDSVGIQRNGTG